MFKAKTCIFFVVIFCLSFAVQAISAEKVKFGTPVKYFPVYYLPVLAAEEGDIWKENGLEVEWVSFQGGGPLMQAIAAGEIKIAIGVVSTTFPAIASGIPVINVAELEAPDDFMIWVRTNSRIKEPKDLKGAKIGVSRFGGAEHAYGRAVVRALDLEKDVKFISTGGINESIAGLKTGVIDGVLLPPENVIMLKLAGEVRELLTVSDYFPKEWSGASIITTKDYLKNKPEVVRKVVKSILQATEFIRKNPKWAIEKMKEISGYSDEAAQYIYSREIKRFTRNGKIGTKALGNVRDFVIKYELVPEQKAPAFTDVYTSQFTD